MRRRALRSVLFKQQHGLLAAADLGAALPHIVTALDLSSMSAAAGDPADALAVLQLLDSLMHSGQAGKWAERALQCRADQALIRLADAATACTAPASALLGQLLCADGEAGQACAMQTPCIGGQLDHSNDKGASASPAASRPVLQIGTLHAAATPSGLLPPSPPLALWSYPHLAASSALPAMRAEPVDAWAGSSTSSGLGTLPRSAAAEALSEEDQQQLFEVALELGAEPHAATPDEAALLSTLATLRHGVLADMPAAAVAGEPALVASLLRLLDGAGPQPRAAAAALDALQVLAAQLGASRAAAQAAAAALPGYVGLQEGRRDDEGTAALARQVLLRCAKLCSNPSIRHAALPAAAAFAPLLGILDGGPGPARKLLAPLLDALTDTVHLSLVSPRAWGCSALS